MVVVPPGVLVKVHVPEAGKPFKSTLPVAKAQVGCVIGPTIGTAGNGFTFKVTALEFAEGEQVPLTTHRYW